MDVAAIVFLCFLLVTGTFVFGTIFVAITTLTPGTFRLLLVEVPGPIFHVFIDSVVGEGLLGPPTLPVGSLALVIKLGFLLLDIFALVLIIELRLLLLVIFGLVRFVVLGLLGLLGLPPDIPTVLIGALLLQRRKAVAGIGKVDQVLANVLVFFGDRTVVPSSPKHMLDTMMLSR